MTINTWDIRTLGPGENSDTRRTGAVGLWTSNFAGEILAKHQFNKDTMFNQWLRGRISTSRWVSRSQVLREHYSPASNWRIASYPKAPLQPHYKYAPCHRVQRGGDREHLRLFTGFNSSNIQGRYLYYTTKLHFHVECFHLLFCFLYTW